MRKADRDLIIKAKGEVIKLLNEKEYLDIDEEQLEYLVQMLDYVLLGQVQLDRCTISILMEELITTSIYTTTPRLLGVLNIIQQLHGEEDDSYSNEISIS